MLYGAASWPFGVVLEREKSSFSFFSIFDLTPKEAFCEVYNTYIFVIKLHSILNYFLFISNGFIWILITGTSRLCKG